MTQNQNRDLWFTITTSAIPSCFMAFFSDPYSPFKFFIHLVEEHFITFFQLRKQVAKNYLR